MDMTNLDMLSSIRLSVLIYQITKELNHFALFLCLLI